MKLGADEVRHATKVVSYASGLGKTIEWQLLKRVASAASHIIALVRGGNSESNMRYMTSCILQIDTLEAPKIVISGEGIF